VQDLLSLLLRLLLLWLWNVPAAHGQSCSRLARSLLCLRTAPLFQLLLLPLLLLPL
jgi:hypothetical protein